MKGRDVDVVDPEEVIRFVRARRQASKPQEGREDGEAAGDERLIVDEREHAT